MNQVVSVPASGTFVYINNRDRENTEESAFDFTVPNLDFSFSESRTFNCIVKQAIVRNFIPNVQSGVSDAIIFTINSTDRELIIVEGYYNALKIVETVETFLQTYNIGFVVEYDSDLKKVFITVPNGVTLSIKRPQIFNYWQQNKLTYPSKYDRMLEMLGLIQNAGIVYTNQTFVGEDPVNLNGTAFVDINMRAGLDVMHTCGHQLDTVVRVPLDVPYGDDKHYEPTQGACFQLNAESIRGARFTLTDEWGNRMIVPSNTLVSLSLLMIPIE